MLADERSGAVRDQCGRVLRQNWREGRRVGDGAPFAYTCPSPRHYPWQWFWDSCFTAISWRHFDPERSRRELESLLAAQAADGFIGHTIFWDKPLSGPRRFTYNVLSDNAQMTSSIQPPVLAWAWQIAVGDPREVPGIGRLHDWLEANRDLDGDGLIWIVQPDESGLDASPQFDSIWGRRAHGLPGYVLLVHRNRRLGFDARRIEQDGGPVCCEVLTNVLYSLSRIALGRPSLTPRIVERFYDEARGLFFPDAKPALVESPAVTFAALSPLALPDLPEQIGRRLIEEHLLDPDSFWLKFPPPSVAADDPSFSLDDTPVPGVRRYWRGPTWVNTAWLAWLGLRRLGYERRALELAEKIAELVADRGLREYYNPYGGRGMGTIDFAWSSLVMEMIEPHGNAAGE